MNNGIWAKWGDAVKVAISFGSVLVLLMGVNFAVMQWMINASEGRIMKAIVRIEKRLDRMEDHLSTEIKRIDERLDSFGERIARNETRLNAN